MERTQLQPIDPQTNGPQLLYGLRYHVHIVKPGEVETFHDQVGYWLWEPATRTVYQTLSIPRAQVAMASGRARAGARKFTVRAERGSTVNGICSNPFLEHAYRTVEWSITVSVTGPDLLLRAGDAAPDPRAQEALPPHRPEHPAPDRPPTPNPTARPARRPSRKPAP